MKHAFVHKEGSSRLLLIFAGWGMDANVFGHLHRPGYDVMVVWDYRSFHIDWKCTASYSEICLLAWSMGVFAATQSVQAIEHKITKRVAVGGTPYPVDDELGIPQAVFNGTLSTLSEATLRKFNRRMCHSPEMLALFNAHAPDRHIDELRDELQAIADRLILAAPSSLRWDLAIGGRNDMIFPHLNQRRAWEGLGVRFQTTDDAHFFDFEALANRLFIDKHQLQARFSQGMATYDSHAAVQADVVHRLDLSIRGLGIDRALIDSQNVVLEIGSGSGLLSRRIARYLNRAKLLMWDIAAPMPPDLPVGHGYEFVQCDAETALGHLRAECIDHIFTASTVQWFNSPSQFLDNCLRVLRPGGYLAVTTFTHGNLHEVSDITKHTLPLLTAQEWLDEAAKRFEVAFSSEYERDLDFATALDALRHLKLTGVNSLGRTTAGHIDTRALLRQLQPRLDGRYHLTYKPFIMILRKP